MNLVIYLKPINHQVRGKNKDKLKLITSTPKADDKQCQVMMKPKKYTNVDRSTNVISMKEKQNLVVSHCCAIIQRGQQHQHNLNNSSYI